MKLDLNTDLIQMMDINSYTLNLNDFDYNMEDFNNAILDIAPKYIEKIFNLILGNVEILNCKMYNPKYYNYSGDSMDYTIEFKALDFYNLLFKCNNDNFFEWLKNRYKSYDGFISNFKNTKEEFFEQDFEKIFCSVIQYYISLNIEVIEDKIYQNFYEDLYMYFEENFNYYEEE